MCSCLCMHVCAQHVEARGWHWVFSSVALNLAFWDMIHRWTWSSAVCACWLASEFRGSMCLCFPNAGIVDLCYDLYIGQGDRTQLSIFVWQLLYRWSHLPHVTTPKSLKSALSVFVIWPCGFDWSQVSAWLLRNSVSRHWVLPLDYWNLEQIGKRCKVKKES